MRQRTGKKFNKPGWKLHREHFIWIFHMKLGNIEIFLCGADSVDILAPYLFTASCQVQRLILSNQNDLFVFIMIFFVIPDETINPKVKELHLQTLTPSSECVWCSSVRINDTSKGGNHTRASFLFQPILDHLLAFLELMTAFWAMWGLFESTAMWGNLWGINILSSRGHPKGFHHLTWQMLRNENSSLVGCEFSTFTGLHDYFSFLAMLRSPFNGNCSITGCFPLDYSLLMPDWLAKFLPNPGSETHLWSNSKESETDLFILAIKFCLQPVNWWIKKKSWKSFKGYFLDVYNKKVSQQPQISVTSSTL